MGLPVTVYQSTDAGAPFPTPIRPSEWITVLKKCLVEGYGGKPPLGWSIAFEDAASQSIIFRQDPAFSAGWYVKVSSVSGTDAVGEDLVIDVAKSATDIANMVSRLGSRVWNVLSAASTSSESGVAGWFIQGCAKGFWVAQEVGGNTAGMVNTTSSAASWFIFIGELDVFDPNDGAPVTYVHGGSGSTNTGDSSNVTAGLTLGYGTMACTMFAADGSDEKRVYAHNASGFNTTEVFGDVTTINAPIVMYPVVPGVNEHNAVFPGRRGAVPGLYTWPQGGRDISRPFERIVNGVTYKVVRGRTTPVYWLSVGGEWYA